MFSTFFKNRIPKFFNILCVYFDLIVGIGMGFDLKYV